MLLRKGRKIGNRPKGEACVAEPCARWCAPNWCPRQRVIATLDKLMERDLAAGWEDIDGLLEGGRPSPRLLLHENEEDTSNFAAVPL